MFCAYVGRVVLRKSQLKHHAPSLIKQWVQNKHEDKLILSEISVFTVEKNKHMFKSVGFKPKSFKLESRRKENTAHDDSSSRWLVSNQVE